MQASALSDVLVDWYIRGAEHDNYLPYYERCSAVLRQAKETGQLNEVLYYKHNGSTIYDQIGYFSCGVNKFIELFLRYGAAPGNFSPPPLYAFFHPARHHAFRMLTIRQLWYKNMIDGSGRTILHVICESPGEWKNFVSKGKMNYLYKCAKMALRENPFGTRCKDSAGRTPFDVAKEPRPETSGKLIRRIYRRLINLLLKYELPILLVQILSSIPYSDVRIAITIIGFIRL